MVAPKMRPIGGVSVKQGHSLAMKFDEPRFGCCDIIIIGEIPHFVQFWQEKFNSDMGHVNFAKRMEFINY